MSKAKNTSQKPAETGAEQSEQQTTQESAQTAQEAPKAPGAGKLTPLKKITVKEICGVLAMADIPPLFIGDASDPQPNPQKELKVARIAGFASGAKQGTSNYGPWAALTGEFSAANHRTGELFAGKVAIVPGAMGEALVTATEEALSRDVSAKVRFSVDISVSRSPREPDKKYVYHVRPVIEAQLGSPAMALLTMEA